MNKIFKYFLLSMFLFFLFIIPVKADSDCAEINNKIENYKTYEEKIKSLDCDNNKDEQTVIQCNNIKLQQNMIISELMKLNDEKQICKSKTSEVNKIIKDNEDRCGKVFDDDFTDSINTIFTIFYIVGPILLIVFGSLDYAKASVSGDEKSLKKAHKTFFKRMLATVLLFISPIIVNFIINLSGSGYMLSGNAYVCDYEFSLYTKEWDIKYTAKQRKTTATTAGSNQISVNTTGVQAMLDAAKQLNQKFRLEHWTYGACSGSNIEYSVNCSHKHLVCADLIAQVLYLGNVFTAEEINSTKYNGCCGLYHFLLEQGWQEITRYEDLQAGDVCFFKYAGYHSSHGGAGEKYYSKHVNSEGKHVEYGHTALYAGDDTWYDTGSDSSIVRESPYKDTSYHKSTFSVALRMP